ncbi:RNA polymerase sigma factor [uncultured Coprobacter sp.]|uniref:RNA polymerase sigma factor n=1 Tax=uncultured Coprobacter sp. TaxID=1720550 RepID=UPI00262854DE|nr:RNA polymerase sigma factor [uncultured Coprobacter sp.]
MKNLDFDIKLCEYQSLMLKYAVSLTHNYNDALDIVQDVNYQILKNRDKFESQQYTLDISFVFVRNRFISLTRKSRILYIEQETVCNDQIENNTIFYDYEYIIGLINRMDTSTRILINLLVQGKSYKEIGHILCIKEGTVKSRIHNIRKKIKDLLPEYFQ